MATFSTKVQVLDLTIIQQDGSQGYIYLKRYGTDCKILAKWHANYVEMIIDAINLTVSPSNLIGGMCYGVVGFLDTAVGVDETFCFSATDVNITSISGNKERLRFHGVTRSSGLTTDGLSTLAN